ncbi:hypothetical protein KOW79_018986 [Hemibagrus wyckioides]|uniref:Uncharacterized protein n=1 Tax=Hemibagrus wyckioides TaxID=337641 RepID=A0A9D3N757_9TELE|nr:hypothetical protein KOW79_018986 [Hemibagrus wyckioides]
MHSQFTPSFPPSLPPSFPLIHPPSLGSLPETHILPKASHEIVSARYRLQPSPVPSYTHQGIVGSVQLLRVGGTSVPWDSSRPEGRLHHGYRFTCSANNCSDIPPLNGDKELAQAAGLSDQRRGAVNSTTHSTPNTPQSVAPQSPPSPVSSSARLPAAFLSRRLAVERFEASGCTLCQ